MDIQIDAESFYAAKQVINSCIGSAKSFANSYCSLNLSDLDNVSINKEELKKAIQDIESLLSKMNVTIEVLSAVDESNAILFSNMELISAVFGDGNLNISDLIGVNTEGLTDEQVGDLIIQKAYELYENFNKYFDYMSPSDARDIYGTGGRNPRVLAYNGEMHNGSYQIDCNAFVSIVLNKALGIGVEKAYNEDDFKFVVPNKYTKEWVPLQDCITQIATGLTLEEALELAQPGDILGSVGDGYTHVQIYAGNGVVIDNGGAKVGDGPISLRTVNGHPDTGLSIRHQGGDFTILRVNPSSVKDISNVKPLPNAQVHNPPKVDYLNGENNSDKVTSTSNLSSQTDSNNKELDEEDLISKAMQELGYKHEGDYWIAEDGKSFKDTHGLFDLSPKDYAKIREGDLTDFKNNLDNYYSKNDDISLAKPTNPSGSGYEENLEREDLISNTMEDLGYKHEGDYWISKDGKSIKDTSGLFDLTEKDLNKLKEGDVSDFKNSLNRSFSKNNESKLGYQSGSNYYSELDRDTLISEAMLELGYRRDGNYWVSNEGKFINDKNDVFNLSTQDLDKLRNGDLTGFKNDLDNIFAELPFVEIIDEQTYEI